MIIDLGEVAANAPGAGPDARPATVADRSRPAPSRRTPGVFVILIVLAFGVSASAVPAGFGLRVAARIPIGVNARLMVVGTTAIVSDRRADVNEVAAYDLASGRSLWRAPLAGTSLNAQMYVAGSTVVVQTAHDVGYDQVEAFALATGVRRWLMPAVMQRQVHSTAGRQRL